MANTLRANSDQPPANLDVEKVQGAQDAADTYIVQ